MQGSSKSLVEHIDGTTLWPPATAGQPSVHGQLIRDGTQGQEKLIDSTTTRPPDTAANGEPHKRLVSKDSRDYGDQFDVTTLHDGGAAWSTGAATTTSS